MTQAVLVSRVASRWDFALSVVYTAIYVVEHGEEGNSQRGGLQRATQKMLGSATPKNDLYRSYLGCFAR